MVRFKTRYVLFEVVRASAAAGASGSAGGATSSMANSLREGVQTHFGDHGLATVQLSLNGARGWGRGGGASIATRRTQRRHTGAR